MTRGSLPRPSARGAFRFVLLIGVVSLFSDMTHEGARSVSGPFLASLGASALIVSAVAGFGELLGYVLRLVFGLAADRTGRYWPITIVGYVLQMSVVPLLALAMNWPVAALLIMAERIGRAIRNPARDAMLAHAAVELGGGRVFGVREALDASGGMIGPLIIAVVLAMHGGFRGAFALLALPAVLTIVVRPEPAGPIGGQPEDEAEDVAEQLPEAGDRGHDERRRAEGGEERATDRPRALVRHVGEEAHHPDEQHEAERAACGGSRQRAAGHDS